MGPLVDLLSSTPLLLLFVVIGVGFLLGNIRVFGFSLGPAAVLFSGIFFGALDPRLHIPDFVYTFGLILFVYSIGLQSGPTFFSSFGKRTVRANLVACAVILFAGVLCFIAWKIINIDGASAIGVFCGSLTNTPALAASIEAIRDSHAAAVTSREALDTISNAPVVGYGVAYPFGVVGVLLGLYLFGRISKLKPVHRGHDADPDIGETVGPITARTYRVVNPGVIGMKVADIFGNAQKNGLVLSRLRRGETMSLVHSETVLEQDDLVVAVGNASALNEARKLLGKESPEEIQTDKRELGYRRIVVSEKKVVGRTIGELNLQDTLDVTITRVRRGDVDFVPSTDTVLEMGDRIRAVTWLENMERATRFFGDSVRSSSEADFLSLSVGVVLGVLLGMVPLPLPGGSTFKLGFAGGPLIVGLILGRTQRTGAIVWGMPFNVNLTLRQVGLVMFLAGIGTKAGDGFLHAVAQGGVRLMATGAVITTLVTIVTLFLGTRFLKLSLPGTMGMMSGIQTQPACLAYANQHSASNAPNLWYAAVYPASMISKIILAQILVRLLLLQT